MAEALFKTGEFAGFRVHDAFAVAANAEPRLVFNLGSVPWPDQLEPTRSLWALTNPVRRSPDRSSSRPMC